MTYFQSFEEEGIFVGVTVVRLRICNNIANTMLPGHYRVIDEVLLAETT